MPIEPNALTSLISVNPGSHMAVWAWGQLYPRHVADFPPCDDVWGAVEELVRRSFQGQQAEAVTWSTGPIVAANPHRSGSQADSAHARQDEARLLLAEPPGSEGNCVRAGWTIEVKQQ